MYTRIDIMHETLTCTIVYVIHRQQVFPDECYPYAHDHLLVCIISFDSLEKSLCA